MDWSGINGAWWRLRRPTWADEAAIQVHGRHPDSSWIGIRGSTSPELAAHVLGEFMKGVDGDFGLVHVMVVRDSDEIVGMISAQERPDGVEIAYGVAPAWRCRGLATEVLSAVTRAVRDQDPAGRYELVIAPQNAASIRVAEKCGYRFAGPRRSVVEGTGQVYDDLLYLPPRSE